MSTEEKYKELKRKYVTLKEAVKHFHDDYEKVTAELASRKAECVGLEEKNMNLQKAYDSLTDEISSIKARKSPKSLGSTWEKTLTLIKKGGQSTPATENDETSVLYNEIVSLKTQLEVTAHEKEEMLKEQHALKNEWDNQKFEYTTGISELKERVLALEGILKEIQGNLDAAEAKAATYSSQINELNKTLENRNNRIEKLEDEIEIKRQCQTRYMALLEAKLSTKLRFDLRRLSMINVFNPYHRPHRYDWSVVRHGVDSIGDTLILSICHFFRGWHAALQFSKGSQIVTDSLLQHHQPVQNDSRHGRDAISSSTLSNKRLDSLTLDLPANSAEGEAVSSSKADDDTGHIDSFANIDIQNVNIPEQLSAEYNGINGHLWLAMETYRQKSLSILSELITLSEEMRFHGTLRSTKLSQKMIELICTLMRYQRIYFCLEEYLYPNTQGGSGASTPRAMQHGTRPLIQCLGVLCRAISKIHNRYIGIISCLDDLAINEFEDVARVLSSELEGSTTASTPTDYRKPSCWDIKGPLDSSKNHGEFRKLPDLNVASMDNGDQRLSALFDEVTSVKPLVFLSRHLFSTIKELVAAIGDFRSAISYRLCCPKILGTFFSPLSGGSSQMIEFSSSIPKLEECMSLFSDDIVSAILLSMLQWRRDRMISVSPSSSKYEKYESGTDHAIREYVEHPTLKNVVNVNAKLLSSKVRISLDDIESNLVMAEADRRQITSCNERLRIINEELMVARTRCNSVESELREYRNTDQLNVICASEFNKLASRYQSHQQSDPANGAENNAQLLSELQTIRYESTMKVKKLSAYVRHLVRSVEMLEDSNRLLKQALSQHVDQYTACKEAENSIHLNYSEQLALMSEHISELNNSIVQAEYKVTEFSKARITCPFCKTTCSIGSIMNGNAKGCCTSCSRRLIHQAD